MPKEKQEAVYGSYTVEREFLARISVTELIDRMIQSHISHISGREDGAT